MKPLSHLITVIAGEEGSISLQHRIINVVTLVGAVLSLLAFGSNIAMGFHRVTIAISLLGFVVFLLAYLHSRYTNTISFITYFSIGFLILVFTPTLWLSNGGSSGSFQYYIPMFLVAIHISTKGKIRFVFITLLLIVIFILLWIEYLYPNMVVDYQSRNDRYIDIFIGYSFSLTGIIILLNTYYKQYLTAYNNLQSQNTVLKSNQQKILLQQEKIEKQKSQLEKKAETLQKLNETKDRFFSIISHDLKNPLGAIISLSDSLVDNKKHIKDEDTLVYIDLIDSASKNAHKLLLDLLEWARSQTNMIECKRKKLDLRKMVFNNVDLLESQSSEKGINIVFENGDLDYYVDADEYMTNAILRNLISNAIKFSNQGNITVDLKKDKSTCILKIIDTGIGMNQESLDQLFCIDKCISTRGTNGETGTGLGLILCKEFVEKNGGSISAISEVDKGSVFKVKLPLFRE